MRPSRDETWLRVAAELARRSTCLRRAVGCVLVNASNDLLSEGYNGRARGLPHCNMPSKDLTIAEATKNGMGIGAALNKGEYPFACPDALRADGKRWPSGRNLDGCEAIHAEQNALLKCRDVQAVRTCYVTASPCLTCVKLLMQTGCQRIVFAERYAHDDAAWNLWFRHRGNDDTWVHHPIGSA